MRQLPGEGLGVKSGADDDINLLTLSSDEAKFGKNSLQMSGMPGETLQEAGATLSIAGLKAGESYMLSAYMKTEGGRIANVALKVGRSFVQGNLPNSEWRLLKLKFVAESANANLVMNAYNLGPNEKVYWDGLQLEQGETVTDFTNEVLPKSSMTIQTDENVKLVLYVFSDHKKYTPGFNTEYAGDVPVKDIKRLAVNDDGSPWMETKKSMYLTKLTRSMKQSEMTDDLIIRDAGDNTAVGGVNQSPVGSWRPILVFGLLVGLELFGLGYHWYSKSKKEVRE